MTSKLQCYDKNLGPFPRIYKCTKFSFSGPNATQIYRHDSKRCLPPSGRWGWVFRHRTSLPCPWTDNLRTWDCGCHRPWPLWSGQPWCGRRECSSSPWTDSQHKSTKQTERKTQVHKFLDLSSSVNIKDWYLTFKSYNSSKSFDAGFYIQKIQFSISMFHEKNLFILCRNVFLFEF